MGRIKRISTLISILKDKVCLIKATLFLSTTNPTTLHHLAILRATTHSPTDPPPETTLDDILTIGNHHRATASAVVDSLLRRLHRTHSPHVALKCLLTLHHILSRGSPLFTDHIISQDLNSLNLRSSDFHNRSDADTWVISTWVRWYAQVLEQILILSRSLGFFLSHLTSQTQSRRGERVSRFKTATLLMELGSLVTTVEQICRAPESLHYQRIGLIYEVMKLVGEDYRLIMREITARINEINGRIIEELSDDQMKELVGNLERLEGCKEKVLMMFLNKKKNDGVWELIDGMNKEVKIVRERRDNLRLVTFQGSESQQIVAVDPRSSTVVPKPRGRRWLDVEWNTLVVSLA